MLEIFIMTSFVIIIRLYEISFYFVICNALYFVICFVIHNALTKIEIYKNLL